MGVGACILERSDEDPGRLGLSRPTHDNRLLADVVLRVLPTSKHNRYAQCFRTKRLACNLRSVYKYRACSEQCHGLVLCCMHVVALR